MNSSLVSVYNTLDELEILNMWQVFTQRRKFYIKNMSLRMIINNSNVLSLPASDDTHDATTTHATRVCLVSIPLFADGCHKIEKNCDSLFFAHHVGKKNKVRMHN